MKRFLIVVLLFVSAFCLAGCSLNENEQDNGLSNGINKDVYNIYNLSKENGYEGTYEEWINSICGKDGEDGKTPYIGENGNWYLGNTDTGVKAEGTNGIDGNKLMVGATAPKSSDGNDDDLYIDLLNWNVYIKNNSKWEFVGCIKSLPGTDGLTPHIGENGNWYIGTTDTGVKAAGTNGDNGLDGLTPHIGENGNWYIGTTDTGVKATGSDGLTPKIGENGNWYIGTTDTGIKTSGTDGLTPHIGENGNWYIGTTDTGVKAAATDGDNGLNGLTPHIGENGNWYIGTTDTGVKATGTDGLTPHIGENGNWYIGTTDTEVKAIGRDGSQWLYGIDEPNLLMGLDGDFYIDCSTWNIYTKVNSIWIYLGNIKGNDALHYGEKLTITYDVNGGIMPYGYLDTIEISYGESLKLPIPTRSNYIFKGWYTGKTINDGQITNSTPITKDFNLIALWEEEKYETNQNLYHVRNYDELQLKASGIVNGNNTLIYKYATIYNVPISYGSAMMFNGIDIELSFTKTDTVSQMYQNSYQSTVEQAYNASIKTSMSVAEKTSSKLGFSVSAMGMSANGSVSTEKTVSKAVETESNVSKTMTDTVGSLNANTYVSEIQKGMKYTIGGSACKKGYAYRWTDLTNFDCYVVIQRNYNTGLTTYYFDVKSDGQFSSIIEESNKYGYFDSDEYNYSDYIKFNDDEAQFKEDGLYLNDGPIVGTYTVTKAENNSGKITLNIKDMLNEDLIKLLNFGYTNAIYEINIDYELNGSDCEILVYGVTKVYDDGNIDGYYYNTKITKSLTDTNINDIEIRAVNYTVTIKITINKN